MIFSVLKSTFNGNLKWKKSAKKPYLIKPYLIIWSCRKMLSTFNYPYFSESGVFHLK